ncbi:hypothetical protein EPUS_02093 [Endocarpon pusillum Z07020]|uniref:DNA sliding clamp PCNA n=1 Tax=Endocarpon pusillum (strain Z07020 / HMAS-L-300199) TaxID=1263415 RepID=U1GK37_ENDPU|nr:uncharacterized protein EPUS_02093 [Endocarpon pusillum Z07020]ERF72206.1 hypothetical protein EPUS_02093 [Endocarpon pusillum Z07020]
MSNTTDSQSLAIIVRELRRFNPDTEPSADQLDQQITLARSIIRHVDQTSILQRATYVQDQVLIISLLQDLAYHDPDSGGIFDIAQWCVRHWLRLLQEYPEDVGVLQGLGQSWLLRSQNSLARIQREEGSPSSGSYYSQARSTYNGSWDEAAEIARATAEANSWRHTANYVEARGTLVPATEYLTRAVNVAERNGVLRGQLLALAAEAYMSIGNVSYAPGNEQYFRQALAYLRRASQIQGAGSETRAGESAQEGATSNPTDLLIFRLWCSQVVDAIKDLVQDCNFDCNDSGIALQAMDNSHVALVSMILKAESFSPFRCDRNLALGINLTSLTKVLRAAQNEDILTLKAEDAPDVVNLVFESSETDRLSEYDIKLMDIDQEHLGIPDTDYAATIEMPSSEFQRICRDLIAMSESVSIEASKDGVRFSCQGDIGSGSVTVRQHSNVEKPDHDVSIQLSEPVALTFSLKYLVNFCKASGLSAKVKLCLSQEVPLLVEYPLAGNSYLRFYLAPKIGDDE